MIGRKDRPSDRFYKSFTIEVPEGHTVMYGLFPHIKKGKIS